jgi:hypothetical protein
MKENNTNFDSLVKNLENNAELYDLVYRILINGAHIPFSPDASLTRLGRMYGIFKDEANTVKIHNQIYEQRLYTYMTVRAIEENRVPENRHLSDQFTLEDGSLNLPKILRNFQKFMKEQYSKRNIQLIEREWRLIFLAFLKPILNGKGHDFKEVETSEEKRLDIVITYLKEKYIIELKIWRGDEAHKRGLNQLANYLDIHGVSQGWLVIFDDTKKPLWQENLINHNGKEIFAVRV